VTRLESGAIADGDGRGPATAPPVFHQLLSAAARARWLPLDPGFRRGDGQENTAISIKLRRAGPRGPEKSTAALVSQRGRSRGLERGLAQRE